MKITLARSDELKIAVQYDDEADPAKPLRLIVYPAFDRRYGAGDFDLIARMFWRANNRMMAANSRGGMRQLVENQRDARNSRRQRERQRARERRAGSDSTARRLINRPLEGVVG